MKHGGSYRRCVGSVAPAKIVSRLDVLLRVVIKKNITIRNEPRVKTFLYFVDHVLLIISCLKKNKNL